MVFLLAGPVATLHSLGTGDWRQLLHSVVLECQGLRSLRGLAAAPNLVSASLADNLVCDLSELAACTRIQHLDINNNLVTEVRRLAG